MTGKEVMCSSRSYESGVEGGMVRISEMRAFSNHPYHVEKDAAMLELVDSIQTEGILVPLLLRPVENENYKYGIVPWLLSMLLKIAFPRSLLLTGCRSPGGRYIGLIKESISHLKIRTKGTRFQSGKNIPVGDNREELINEFIRQRENAGINDDELEQYYRQLEEFDSGAVRETGDRIIDQSRTVAAESKSARRESQSANAAVRNAEAESEAFQRERSAKEQKRIDDKKAVRAARKKNRRRSGPEL